MPPSRLRVVASALIVFGLASCGSDRDAGLTASTGPKTGSTPGGAPEPAQGWAELPASPLTPRARAVEVWTGDVVLVVGGDTFTCPPNADCAAPTDPPLADGAAFDPSTGAWRTIASSPVAFSWASTAVLGDEVYFLVPGPTGSREPEATFLRYSVAGNSWAQLPRPPSGESLVAAGQSIVAFAGSDERGEKPDLVFDPRENAWRELPADPLSPEYDRVMTWSGAHLYLFDHELVPNPGSDRPSLTRAARLDLVSGTWERLPDSEILGTGPWFGNGTTLVTPMPGSADGGEVNNWGRGYPDGGIFDTATATWSSLPAPPPDAAGAGVIGSRDALFTASEGSLLDLETNSWIELSPIPGHRTDDERRVVSAGADAFVFGGVRWAGKGSGELLADAWIWRSGRGDDGRQAAESLTRSGGCGDAFLWAANSNGTLAITFTVDARERRATGPTIIDFTVPDASVKVEVQRGRGLVQPFCNDVIDGNVWRVDSRRPAAAGTGRITLAAAGAVPPACGARGELHAQDLVAEDGTKFDAIDIKTDSIGCYAG